MTKEQAIQIATKIVLENAYYSAQVDFGRVSAKLRIGDETMKRTRLDFPTMNLSFEMPDWWIVDFPLFKRDTMLRDSIDVRVDDKSGKAAFAWAELSEMK